MYMAHSYYDETDRQIDKQRGLVKGPPQIRTRKRPPVLLFFEPKPSGTTPGPWPPGPRSVSRLFRGYSQF
jgi:hypothetical protein